MTKSTGKNLKIKIKDRVMFTHVATGSKPMSGQVIEESQTLGFLVRHDKNGRIYPGVKLNDPKSDGTIISKIK